jgi:BNR repeat-like domain
MIKLLVSFNALIFSILAFFSAPKTEKLTDVMPMCSTSGVNTWTGSVTFPTLNSVKMVPSVFETDSGKAYSMPLLTKTPSDEILLSWTEKVGQENTFFRFATSKDKGKTFSTAKTIYSGAGIGNSRLMRAKVLAKKDGSLVAVFFNRADAPKGGKGRGGRSGEIVYCVSKDGGSTWTTPQSVDSDPTKGIMRGFFDAVLMSNDEIAIAYLKDVKGSTKHEERDLRLVTTKNGVFQPEKLMDPVVCDCCNINLLVDANGALNVYYRDNNDDIRDIARLISTDDGETFSKSQIVYNDGWKIQGCPHNGAVSTVQGKSALVAWYSGSETEAGIRLVTQEGKKLFVLNEPSVKNPCLIANSNQAVMLWEQNVNHQKTQLVFKKINVDKISETLSVEDSDNATNSTALIVDNQLVIAHEVKQSSGNILKISALSF